MNRQLALTLLGLDNMRCSLTEEIVREAFTKRIKETHPDSQPLAATYEQPLASDVKDARDFLLKNLSGNADFACKLCNGLGMVRAGIGWLKCSACKGTGEKR